jgi:hypothetical protein
MARSVWRFYQRHRIVNVNLNIIGAGLLAVAISKFPVLWLSALIGSQHKLINSLAAAVVDGIVDIGIYYALHWIANHWRPIRPRDESDAPDNHAAFWKNASLVQFERLTLTPLFYLIAIPGMWALQHAGWSASWAFVASFSVGLVVTRVVHTAWALKTGRFEPLPSRNGKARPGVPTTTDMA